jgi:hypothetical protein
MPILPIPQPRNLDIPNYPIGNSRAPESTFANLAGIGDTIANYRDQQALGELAKTATDASGNLDINKFATAVALSGRDPTRLINAITARQQVARSEESQKALAAHYTATEKRLEEQLRLQREIAEQGKVQRFKVDRVNPYTDEVTTEIHELGPGGYKIYTPPAGTVVPPPTTTPAPKPQSQLVPLTDTSAPQAAGLANPEEGPPYQVAQAGPLTVGPPSQQEPTAQPRPGEVGGPPLRPDIKEQRKELGKKIIDQQTDMVKSAQAAREMQPLFDEGIKAWQDLMKTSRGGYNIGFGPIFGSTAGRVPAALLGTEEEKIRQRFDTSMAAIRARITAIQNKGEGAVSNYERQLYAMQFPDLTKVDPASQLNFLTQQRAIANQFVDAAKETDVGRASTILGKEPPAITPSKQEKVFGDEKLLGFYRSPTGVIEALKRAQDLLNRKVPPADVKRVLDEIDPSLAPKIGL